MGVILPVMERDGIFPQFFHGLGRDDFFFVGVERERFEIHSHVTLYFGPRRCRREPSQQFTLVASSFGVGLVVTGL